MGVVGGAEAPGATAGVMRPGRDRRPRRLGLAGAAGGSDRTGGTGGGCGRFTGTSGVSAGAWAGDAAGVGETGAPATAEPGRRRGQTRPEAQAARTGPEAPAAARTRPTAQSAPRLGLEARSAVQAEADGGGDVRGAGEKSDSSRPTTPASSGVSAASRTPGASGGQAAGLSDAFAGRGGLDGEGVCSGRLQAEKGGSGLETGGNSDSGGPDDARPDGDGDVSHGAAGAAGAAAGVWAGAGEEASSGWPPPRGAKGRRAETRKPHASQNWPTTGAPQRAQVSPALATNRPGA